MERRSEMISEAKKRFRDFSFRGQKRRSRIHNNAKADTVDRMRALLGRCGECTNLDITLIHSYGKEVAALGCDAGNDPLALYQNTEIGEKAECEDFEVYTATETDVVVDS